MKTKKVKGFTLGELIVVIAIIGVLAAILVPSMLGYVKKSKVSSANTSASSIYKALNTALTDMDGEGIDMGGTYCVEADKSTGATTEFSVSTGSGDVPAGWDGTKLYTKVKNYFEDIEKCEVYAQIVGGTCKAVAASSDSTYIGTHPAVVTVDNYEAYKTAGLSEACKQAYNKAQGNTVNDPSASGE